MSKKQDGAQVITESRHRLSIAQSTLDLMAFSPKEEEVDDTK